MAKLNEYGFSEKDWAKTNKQVRDWIQLNKELWSNLTSYEKQALKTGEKMAKNAKEASESAKEVRNLAAEQAKIIKNTQGDTKASLSGRATLLSMGAKALKLDLKGDALSKKKLKSITGIVDITGDYLSNQQAIGTEEFRSLDFNKQIREAIRAKNVDEELYLRKLKAEYDIQKKVNDEVNTQTDLIKKPFEAVDGMIKQIPIFGDLLSKRMNITGKGEDFAQGFVESAKEAAAAQNELELQAGGQATGKDGKYTISTEAQAHAKKQLKSQGKLNPMLKKVGPYALAGAAAMGAMAVSAFNFAKDLGVGFTQISPGMMLFRSETKALLDEFGSVNDISTESLWTMKKASFFSGVQASDMAKIAMLQTSITGDTKEMALDKQAKFMKDIKSEGLSASKVMGDLASNADMFANFAKDGGKNMEEAAKQAAQMGLSLDATNSVAEKLLDYEASIAAEQEASMLLGKSINLDKARSLAFSGDLAQMMTEVKNQAGGEAEFAKMSVVQRQALGDAIGLSGAKLAEFMKESDSVTQKSNSNLLSNMGKFAGIAAIVLGIIGGIMGSLTIVGVGFAGLGAMALGALKGAALGALLGGIGGGIATAAGDVMSESKGKTQISPREGGIYNLSPNDDFMAAPGLVNGFGQNNSQGRVAPQSNSSPELQEIAGLLKQANTDRNDGNKKLGRDMNNSFSQR
jgi:hypothetical protein